MDTRFRIRSVGRNRSAAGRLGVKNALSSHSSRSNGRASETGERGEEALSNCSSVFGDPDPSTHVKLTHLTLPRHRSAHSGRDCPTSGPADGSSRCRAFSSQCCTALRAFSISSYRRLADTAQRLALSGACATARTSHRPASSPRRPSMPATSWRPQGPRDARSFARGHPGRLRPCKRGQWLPRHDRTSHSQRKDSVVPRRDTSLGSAAREMGAACRREVSAGRPQGEVGGRRSGVPLRLSPCFRRTPTESPFPRRGRRRRPGWRRQTGPRRRNCWSWPRCCP